MSKTTVRTAREPVQDELKRLDTPVGFRDAVAALRMVRLDVDERAAMREVSTRRENLRRRTLGSW
jgi:hypothetical protein